MPTLAINTATLNSAVALFRHGKLLAETAWQSNADESEKLLKNIQALLKKQKVSLSKLKKIIVISGPGPYTALRVGITVANTFAYSLNIPISSLNHFQLLSLKFKQNFPLNIIINSGRGEVYHFVKAQNSNLFLRAGGKIQSNKIKILKLSDLMKKIKTKKQDHFFVSELTKAQIAEFKEIFPKNFHLLSADKMLSFGLALEKIDLNKLKNEEIALPYYIKPPDITLKK